MKQQRAQARAEDGNWSVWHRPKIKMALAMKYYGTEEWMNRRLAQMVLDGVPGEIQLRTYEGRTVQRIFQ